MDIYVDVREYSNRPGKSQAPIHRGKFHDCFPNIRRNFYECSMGLGVTTIFSLGRSRSDQMGRARNRLKDNQYTWTLFFHKYLVCLYILCKMIIFVQILNDRSKA